MEYSDALLKRILQRTKIIALVGMSVNSVRPSYYVGRYLTLKGYQVIPINPAQVGKQWLGQEILASLTAVPAGIDVQMVDIFRRSEAVLPIVVEALQKFPRLETIWMQIGVQHAEAAALAEERGVEVIQNRCPKIEYQRLIGDLRMGGFNTGILSSKS